MAPQEFIENRLDPQQQCFSIRSRVNRRFYYFFKALGLIGLTFPLLVGLVKDFDGRAKIVIGILSVTTGVFNGIEIISQHLQKRVNFRMASELLKQENIFHPTRSGYHIMDDNLPHLTSRIEGVIPSQNSVWQVIAGYNTVNKENPSR